ncbi:complex I subunit 4 family protein [Fodinibius sediminis]|uniref:NADH dehydrogenase subunit M n=1 Tax=Fodinibius sediminis TaxID=1214077 RepID=A0A521CYL1_9BACT|nr:NADH-quinone oxidoreductase subunit M [Fodinibius sediminis]SMO64513.1 NADH dehydrogenase subunit M [Fodinibius sediminis]
MEFQFLGLGILSWIVFIPILGMIIILLIPDRNRNAIRWTAAAVTSIQVLLAGIIYSVFDQAKTGINNIESFQFVEHHNWITVDAVPWVGKIKIDYFLGLDGLSILMVILTALIAFVGVISSWNIKKMVKGYFALYLLLIAGIMGVFVALDFFLFFIFWEVMLLPMYFLIGIWGGPQREYAAIKFFLYTFIGGILMLLTMLALYFSVAYTDPATGESIHTFNILHMMNPDNFVDGGLLGGLDTTWRYVAWMALFINFAIKIPIFPFHTWLPDAHVQAPTPISVILAGVLLKLGAYGLLRINFPIFPDATLYFGYFMAVLGMISIIYGAFCAMAQDDFKKLIAYSSISHMGIVILGIAALNTQGMVGGVLQMFNHGIITAVLFLSVGVLYDRTHTRGLYDFGGMANQMPKYTGIAMVGMFAAMGLPGLNGFVSELFSFLGAFAAYRWITIISVTGIIITAAYILWTIQRIFLGKTPDRWEDLKDLTLREYISFVPLIILIVLLGIFPSLAIDLINSSLSGLVELVTGGGI